ncbi:hypothetical protein QKU48_gp0826 [Fadolivirus algeromassiliense]|jgi:hypothetical protein|uniref:Uncharacterized protein n=1 Tax=Fadolivirus FV1/VV64 TaxID=3070911 RepID=A0A7D3QVI1_9VIRU|nr:hypothetical protein QKU48_gp0826 [Fadolivirus algeromassiliense]QKF94284.1 hypothetical protein Fadolivirus_1_826 [Fadolivirus FV1/VV64]
MDRYILILFWVLVCAVILLSVPTKCALDDKKEGFYSYFGYFKNYCGSCGHRSRYSCSKCINCGWAMNSTGAGQCLPGDSSGPFYNTDATYWEYSSPYMYYPYSNLYPVIREKSIYPYYKYKRAQKPWQWNKTK